MIIELEKNKENYDIEYSKIHYHYAAKIYDSLRTGNEKRELVLSTKDGLRINGILSKAFMSIPHGGGSSITPKNSSCSVSSISFDVVNVDYQISKWLYERLNSGNSMTYGEMVDIFVLLGDGSTKLIYRGIIRSISNDQFESKYTFEIADFQDRLKSSIFDRELSKYSAETINDINTYRLPFFTENGIRKGFSIKEVDEGETNDDGQPILTRVITFNGHVIDFVEMIFKIVFSTPRLEIQVPYLTNKYQDFVDINNLKEIKEILNRATYNFYLEIREPIDDPYEYLIENIYKPCAIFPFLNLDGKLGLKLHKQPTVGTTGITINEDNIISIDSKIITDENIINNMVVKYDHDFKEDKEKTKRYFNSVSSFNKFRMLIPNSPEEYIIKGINKLSETDKATFAATLSDSIFSRYGSPGIELEVTLPLEIAMNYKVGDYLFVNHQTIVAWEGDTKGTPGIKINNETTQDPYNGIAHFNVKHDWGGFITDNTLGKSIDGNWIIDTTSKEIIHEIFNSTTIKSCVKNHEELKKWLLEEGINV